MYRKINTNYPQKKTSFCINADLKPATLQKIALSYMSFREVFEKFSKLYFSQHPCILDLQMQLTSSSQNRQGKADVMTECSN